MNLMSILKSVGSAVISNVVPGGAAILGVINEFLPDDKKLPDTATGPQVQTAIAGLPPEQQASLMEKEFDVELTEIKEAGSTLRAALEHDANNPHSTRPYIAKGAFHVVAFTTIVTISLWAYGVGVSDDSIIKTVVEGWPFILAAIGPLVALLYAYFGILKREHKDKLDAAAGASNPSGIAGLISAILKK